MANYFWDVFDPTGDWNTPSQWFAYSNPAIGTTGTQPGSLDAVFIGDTNKYPVTLTVSSAVTVSELFAGSAFGALGGPIIDIAGAGATLNAGFLNSGQVGQSFSVTFPGGSPDYVNQTVTFSGHDETFNLTGGGTLIYQPNYALAGGTIHFGDGAGDAVEVQYSINDSTIPETFTGLTGTDAIVLERVAAANLVGSAVDFANGAVTLEGTAVLQLPDISSGSELMWANVGGHAALELACFAEGTHIATTRGPVPVPVPVQALALGDLIVAPDGTSAPVRWLGHRGIDCRRHPRPQDVWPVRVRRDAFGPGLPQRDLLLSPDHAVFANGVLIPVRHLLNGATVMQEKVATIRYWHVELPAHGLLLAEGLACESYLDTGNRSAFANGGPVVQRDADFALRTWHSRACAPIVVAGPALAAVRRTLHQRATALGHIATDQPDLRVLAAGRVLRPVASGPLLLVGLPGGTQSVRLLSRSAVPEQMHESATDTRRLGIALARLVLDDAEIALDDARLSTGWHAPETTEGRTVWRWTDGDAHLAVTGARTLGLSVALTATYWHAPDAAQAGMAA